MASVFAECPEHGLITTSSPIAGSGNVLIMGSAIRCPLCGRMAYIVDGDYEMRDHANLPTIFHPLTPAQGRRLATAIRWAQNEVTKPDSDEELIKEKIDRTLDREAPWLKSFIDLVLSDRAANLYTLLSFIIVVLTFLGVDPASQPTESPAPPSPGITEEQLRELLDEYLESDTGSDTPTRPAPEREEPSPTEPPTTPA